MGSNPLVRESQITNKITTISEKYYSSNKVEITVYRGWRMVTKASLKENLCH